MPQWAVLKANQRERARLTGLCTRCCREKPQSDRSICVSCNRASYERVQRKRDRDRTAAEREQLLASLERAGDAARQYCLYTDAAQHYENAIKQEGLSPDDRVRISEKLAQTLFLSGDPRSADKWIKHAFPKHLTHHDDAEKTADMLLKEGTCLYVNLKIKESIPLIAQAIHIVEKFHDRRLWKRANLHMAGMLQILGHYEKSRTFLRNVGRISPWDGGRLRINYYSQQASAAMNRGHRVQTYRHFNRAVEAANEGVDEFQMTSVWTNYSLAAEAFGNLELSKSCIERGLFIARQHQIAWLVAQFSLYYADVLAKFGQYDQAYGYLIDALSHDIHAPLIDATFVEIGIPLALHLNDTMVLEKCTRLSILPQVFHSGAIASIGPVAAAIAQLYDAQGHRQKAQSLLAQALDVVNHVDQSWSLPLEVARRGSLSDIPRARTLLETRTALPEAQVAQAFLALFDAFVAHRKSEEVLQHAREAIRKFETMHWYSNADLARTLLPKTAQLPARAVPSIKPFSDAASTLSERERQVIELVLKGLGNRAIAETLAITERTVEAHMTSIMSTLGIRSRHQLKEALP